MIIDVHCHLGWDYTFEENFPKELLVDKLGMVDIQIVQPGTTHTLQDAREQHDAIAALCAEYPGRFFGMAAPNPHLPGSQYEDEIKRCVEELGFTGIKLHAFAAAVSPNSAAGHKVFDQARKHGIPVMVHTGTGLPFAGPVALIRAAGEYPDVDIIMAHCGFMMLADEAEAALAARPNIYGDSSWTGGYLLRDWIRRYGHRFMLASDHAQNLGTELAKIRTFGFTDLEQESILAATALKVFHLLAVGEATH